MKSKSALKKAEKKAEKKAAKKVVVVEGAGKESKQKKVKKDKKSGVIYIGHIPHGYYEGQMRNFLAQYGKIKRLRISRSKKSGKSKGYGYVQFEDPAIASAVAAEVNGTYVTGKVLKVQVVEPEQVHKNLWKAMKVKTLIKKDQDIRINGPLAQHVGLSDKPMEQRLMSLVTKERKNNQKLEKMGIEYTFSGFENQLQQLGLEYVPKAKVTDAAATGKQAVPEQAVQQPVEAAAKKAKKTVKKAKK